MTAVGSSNRDSSVLRPGSIGGLKTYKPADLEFYLNVLIYGEPGIGKTLLAASAVEVEMLSPVLVLNIEQGAKTIKGKYGSGSTNGQIEIVEPVTFKDHQKIFEDLYRGKGCGFKTVVYDNATEGQKVGIHYIFDTEKPEMSFADFEEATWANHGWTRSSEQMRKMVALFRRLPMHKIFVAWRKDISKKADKEKWYPAFSRSFALEAPGMFDDVLYYHWKMLADDRGRQTNTRTIQTVSSVDAIAKTRDGGHKLPDYIKDPTMTKLCKLWGMT